jgi:hypothetical protein
MTYQTFWKTLPLLAACALGGAGGCSAEFPVGLIICDDSSECPDGLICRVSNGSGEGRCFPGSEETSPGEVGPEEPAGSPRDSGTDAEVQAGAPGGHDTGGAGAGGRPSAAGGKGGVGGVGGAAGKGGAAGAAGKPKPETPAAGSGGTEPPDPCDADTRECEPEQVEQDEEACGACNTGQRTRTRSCDAETCSFGSWSAWSECEDPAECRPGDTQSRVVPCPGCGTKSQTSICSPTTCTFEESWTDSSTCSWCEGCGKLHYCDTPEDVVPGRGTWCEPQNGCSDQQAWGRCLEILESKMCQLHEPIFIGPP